MQQVEIYKGYQIIFEHISYECSALRLYGFASLGGLKAAIRKKLKKLSNGILARKIARGLARGLKG